ncbi:MAG: NAD(P)/FAD-dependent oxidoreductase [Actinomycetota bacterium]
MSRKDVADLVVVGAGTLGGWGSYFARGNGAKGVVVLEQWRAGQGASSRAAGIVRAQGGNPRTVKLGQWSIDFYNRQRGLLGTDSGFREHGYLILADTEDDVIAGKERVAMQQAAGLDVRWIDPAEAVELNPTLSKEGHLGGSYVATDGAIDPPRNVRAYSLAMQQKKVELREGVTFLGLKKSRNGKRVTGVETSAGPIATERVLLTGGPLLRNVGRAAGAKVFASGARHQVVVTSPHDAFDVDRQTMIFDVGAGIYWRLEEGGLLWGMSNPDETPGEAKEIDWPYLRTMEERLNALVPVTKGLGIRKAWAATIEFTPDHMPILGPVIGADGLPVEGTTIAGCAGHGMMWGPAVAKIAADLAVKGKTKLIDVSDLGIDRFDEHGRSNLATDPIALPYPVSTGDEK